MRIDKTPLELWLDPNGRLRDIWAKPGPLISCPTGSSQTQMVFSCPLIPPRLHCSSHRTRLDHLEWSRLCNSWLRLKRGLPPSALISSKGLVGPWGNMNRRVIQSMKWYKSEKVRPTHEVNMFNIWQMCCFAVYEHAHAVLWFMLMVCIWGNSCYIRQRARLYLAPSRSWAPPDQGNLIMMQFWCLAYIQHMANIPWLS